MKNKKILISCMVLGCIGIMPASIAEAAMSANTTSSISFQTGALSIVSVPNFEFGTWEISPLNRTYSLQDTANVAVADLRGTSSGWTLTVKQESQLKTQQNQILEGAQILLKDGSTANSSVTIPAQIQLIPGNAATVMASNGNSGSTIIQGSWAAKNVSLTVPGATSKFATQYTTTLTWTLAEVPTADGQ